MRDTASSHAGAKNQRHEILDTVAFCEIGEALSMARFALKSTQ